MRNYFYLFFLLPPVLLLAVLPNQLQGKLPYPISNFSYIASILVWLFIFFAFLLPKWSRLFWVLDALIVVLNASYGLWTGKDGLAQFLFKLMIACLFLAMASPVLPFIRRKIKGYRQA